MPVLAEAGGRLLVDVLRDTMTGTVSFVFVPADNR